MIKVDVANCQSQLSVDSDRLIRATTAILKEFGPARAEISISVVDDATIQPLNRQYLQHDYPTDVLSFPLEEDAHHLEGEVLVSAEMARRVASQYKWSPENELLLYVIHGVLHLVGFDDREDSKRTLMRNQEDRFMREFGAD